MQGHWDSGRNFVHLLRGRRRYILNPTSECRCARLAARACVCVCASLPVP
jgi:hypothetical protein